MTDQPSTPPVPPTSNPFQVYGQQAATPPAASPATTPTQPADPAPTPPAETEPAPAASSSYRRGQLVRLGSIDTGRGVAISGDAVVLEVVSVPDDVDHPDAGSHDELVVAPLSPLGLLVHPDQLDSSG